MASTLFLRAVNGFGTSFPADCGFSVRCVLRISVWIGNGLRLLGCGSGFKRNDCSQALHLTITSCGMGLKYMRVVGYVLWDSRFYHRGRGFGLNFNADCGLGLILKMFYGFRTPRRLGTPLGTLLKHQQSLFGKWSRQFLWENALLLFCPCIEKYSQGIK